VNENNPGNEPRVVNELQSGNEGGRVNKSHFGNERKHVSDINPGNEHRLASDYHASNDLKYANEFTSGNEEVAVFRYYNDSPIIGSNPNFNPRWEQHKNGRWYYVLCDPIESEVSDE